MITILGTLILATPVLFVIAAIGSGADPFGLGHHLYLADPDRLQLCLFRHAMRHGVLENDHAQFRYLYSPPTGCSCSALPSMPTALSTPPGQHPRFAHHLHAVAFGLLYCLDLLWRSWFSCTERTGISDDLSRADAGLYRMVVVPSPACSGWTLGTGDLDRRPDFLTLRQIGISRRDPDPPCR